MRNRFLVHLAVILAYVWGACAFAQTAPGTGLEPPKIHSAVDSYGVDYIGGKPHVPGIALSIGTKESGLVRDPGPNWMGRDSLTGTLVQWQITQTDKDQGLDGSDLPVGTYMIVSIGHGSQMFQESGSSYVPIRGASGTFSCVGTDCQHVALDGTVTSFTKTITVAVLQPGVSFTGPGLHQTPVGAITRITKPDGENITFTYSGHLISAVQSSLGWMIKYDSNGLGTIKAINTSVEYCDPAAVQCNSLTNAWPTATMTITSSAPAPNYSWVSRVTDALGNATIYTFTAMDSAPTYSVTYSRPSGVTYAYTFGNCVQLLSGCSRSNYYPNRDNVITLQIGSNTYSYTRADYATSGTGGVSQGKVPLKATGPDGQFVYYPRLGKTLLYTDNMSRTTAYSQYTSAGYLSKIDEPGSTAITYEYDSRGNVTAVKRIPSDGGAPLLTSATYPIICANAKTCNRPTTITDEAGVTTSYTYSPDHGGVTSETKPPVNGVQAQTRYAYSQFTPYVRNSSGNLVAGPPVWRLTSISKCMTMSLATCVGTTDELRMDIGYAGSNVLPTTKTVMRGDGSLAQTTTTTYDIFGNVASIDGPRAGLYDATYYFYDALRRVIGVIDLDPDGPGPLLRPANRKTYNSDGQLTSVAKGFVRANSLDAVRGMAAREQVVTEYSTTTGLALIERFYVDGVQQKVVQKSYDGRLRLECVALRLNPGAFSSLPSSACTLGSTGPDGNDRITKYTYDATGAPLRTTSAYGTSNQRDDRVNTYEATTGLLSAEADGLGNTTWYSYDSYKRPLRTTYAVAGNGTSQSNTDFVQRNYTGALVSSIRLRDGQSIGFGYDAIARVVSKSGALSESYSYNNFNQVISKTNGSTGGTQSLTSAYAFNSLGWMLSETRYEAGVSMGAVSYGYDAYGRRTQLSWPDGFSISYDYIVGGYSSDFLQSISEQGGASLAIFGYDEFGRRISLTRGNGVVTRYAYDGQSRLTGLSTDIGGGATNDISEIFSYTVAGQLKSRILNTLNPAYQFTPMSGVTSNYGVNALNQVSFINGASVGYDARGNLTSDSSGHTFSYNANNLLTSASQSGVTTAFTYDAENRLFSVAKSGNTTRFIYDGTDLIAEADSNNNIRRRYVHGPGIDDPLVWYEGVGTSDKRFFTIDRQGSVVGTSLQSGLIGTVNAYDEFGVPAPSNSGRFQYTGQTWLSEVGLYYYKARLYNPVLGRFMQADPLGYKDGMNWYTYTGNNPLNRADPTGKYACGQQMGKADCDTFTAAQDAAKAQLASALNTLKGLRSKLSSGAELSKSERKFLDNMVAVLGKGGHSVKSVDAMISAGTKMNAMLNSSVPAERAYGSTDYAQAPAGRLLLFPNFFRASQLMQSEIVAHESAHHGLDLIDSPYRLISGQIIEPYGFKNLSLMVANGVSTNSMLQRPDAITLALGFERDDGY